MARIVAFTSVTLDGVMQAPGRPDEDTRGDFQHGGWATRYADEESGRLAAEGMANTEALLLGRRTYEDLLESWNKQGGPFKEMLNFSPKYVASQTLEEPLRWPNSTLLKGDVREAVTELRDRPGKDIIVMGGSLIGKSLFEAGLVDEFGVNIHPVLLGSGVPLFCEMDRRIDLELLECRQLKTGCVFLNYAVKH